VIAVMLTQVYEVDTDEVRAVPQISINHFRVLIGNREFLQ
jgi:hypothetical protein